MKTEYEQSALSFVEYKDPHTNEVATVLMDRPGGRQAIVATIHKGYDPNAKKSVYRTYDSDGKEILPACYSITFLKKDIRRKEDEFHEKETIKEQSLREDMAQQERKRFKELATLRSQKTKTLARAR